MAETPGLLVTRSPVFSKAAQLPRYNSELSENPQNYHRLVIEMLNA